MGGASLGKRLRYSVSQCPFGELEQHGGIAATGHHASCWLVWCKPEFLQVLGAFLCKRREFASANVSIWPILLKKAAVAAQSYQ
jgi:hypothetical protein